MIVKYLSVSLYLIYSPLVHTVSASTTEKYFGRVIFLPRWLAVPDKQTKTASFVTHLRRATLMCDITKVPFNEQSFALKCFQSLEHSIKC